MSPPHHPLPRFSRPRVLRSTRATPIHRCCAHGVFQVAHGDCVLPLHPISLDSALRNRFETADAQLIGPIIAETQVNIRPRLSLEPAENSRDGLPRAVNAGACLCLCLRPCFCHTFRPDTPCFGLDTLPLHTRNSRGPRRPTAANGRRSRTCRRQHSGGRRHLSGSHRTLLAAS